MSSQIRYSIIGTGAIGGLIGGLLQNAGHEVHFLLHSDYDYVKKQGLVIEFKGNVIHLPKINAYHDISQMPQSDVVILTLKANFNQFVIDKLSSILKPDGFVLIVQNGINIDRQIADCVGNERVVGGILMCNTKKIAPGHIRHVVMSSIELGEYRENYLACKPTDRIHKLAHDFKEINFEVMLSDDLMLSRFRKLCNNIPVNGLNTLLNSYGVGWAKYPTARQVIKDLIHEIIDIAKAWGRIIDPSIIDAQLKHCDSFSINPEAKTSMAQDLVNKKPLELDAYFENVIDLAKQKNIACPKITMLYQLLTFIDEENRTVK